MGYSPWGRRVGHDRVTHTHTVGSLGDFYCCPAANSFPVAIIEDGGVECIATPKTEWTGPGSPRSSALGGSWVVCDLKVSALATTEVWVFFCFCFFTHTTCPSRVSCASASTGTQAVREVSSGIFHISWEREVSWTTKHPPPPSSSAQKWHVSLLPTLNWLNESHGLVSCQWGQEVSSSSKKGHDV